MEKWDFELNLIFGNKTKKDILLLSELNELNDHKQVNINLILDKGEEGWKGLTGFIDSRVMKQCLPKPSNDHLILVCGPPIMNKFVRKDAISLGYKDDNIFDF